MDKWRVWATVRAQCNCHYRLFEVVRNAVVVAQESSMNFAFKGTKNIRLSRDGVLENDTSPAGRSEWRVNRVCQTVESLLSVLLNSCCTLHDATHTHSRRADAYICISRDWGTCIDLRLTVNIVYTAPIWVCNIYWASEEACWACYNTDTLSKAVGALGTALLVCGRKGSRAQRDTEGAEGIVTMIPTFCLKPLIQFIIYSPHIYSIYTSYSVCPPQWAVFKSSSA